MKSIFITVIITALFFLLMWAVNYGMNASAKVDCLQWQAQAQEFTNFYLTKWQSEQCNSVGIIVNAPVK